jgi:hypothetical protein
MKNVELTVRNKEEIEVLQVGLRRRTEYKHENGT